MTPPGRAILKNNGTEKNATIKNTRANIIHEARSVPMTYEFICAGSSFDFCVILAVVAVDDTIPHKIEETIIDELLHKNFVSIYHRYDTPDITTTKNQIE
jgi:hypothetical protein